MPSLKTTPEPIRGEVDLIFGTGDAMILVEVGAGRHAISEKKRKFFSKWNDGSNVRGLEEAVQPTISKDNQGIL